MFFNSYNVLIGVIVLTLCCGLLFSLGLAIFYGGKMTIEIVSGETDYIALFQKMLIAIGIGSLFYMILEIFKKVLDELYKKLPLDLNVIEVNGIHPLSNGAVVVDVSYPMMSDDFTETLCFNSNLNVRDILIHLEERVNSKYSSLKDDEYVREKLNDFFKLTNELLQTL